MALCNICRNTWKKSESTSCPYCAKEKKKVRAKNYDKKERNKESDKFYHSPAWIKVRKQFLSKYPICISCGRPAQMADHIIAVKDGGAKLSYSNLQPMCNICHNKKEHEAGNRW